MSDHQNLINSKNLDQDKKINQSHSNQTDRLLDQPGPSNPLANSNLSNHHDRPRTVRHHRRTLSGRSIRSGHFQFGPSYHPNIYPALNDPFTRQAKHAADNRARARFFKALFMAIGLWVVVGLVLGWAGFQRSGWADSNHRLNYGAKPFVPISDGHPVSCARFTKPHPIDYHSNTKMAGQIMISKAKFLFPLSKDDSFFFHSTGRFAKGHLSFETTESNHVQVQVDAFFNDDALIDLMTVCHLNNGDHQTQSLLNSLNPKNLGQNIGLGIYTPSPEVGPYPDSDLEFQVKIYLPRRLGSLFTLRVQSDLFFLTTTDLSSISFAQVKLFTTSASIIIENLVSEAVEVRTLNGLIQGTFHISRDLSLASTNGAIDIKVGLMSPLSINGNQTSLPNFSRATHHLDQNLEANESCTSSVSVDATTMNGAAEVKYIKHPVKIKLDSLVCSTNGRARVEHTSSYEGNFEAQTTWGSTDLKGPFSQQDPAGKNRPRQYFRQTNRDGLGYRYISGTVWWGDKSEKTRIEKGKSGHSLVKTTLGSAVIIFN
ncbi:hypothetical protein O181_067401 [Austropuccinia psidii MF-1]|uniref:Uncharacterized protein n=1 Tax=Austropuccinia psidii MF-1 TaxID=1389203 RepID=A0A9Q3ESU6_9BASI|nr:hypothetical protein [Austropuccinia psidii MF-1]